MKCLWGTKRKECDEYFAFPRDSDIERENKTLSFSNLDVKNKQTD